MRNIDMADCHVKFGKFIKAARESQGLSQYDVADMLGVCRSYLSYLERGKRDIDLSFALRLCDAVNADLRYFINEYLV
jgi:transcriptional regulator with XRE-family HTH domain